jgi:hypothetical protein
MPKYDGIVEAVRYNADGQISIVRVYERRGPTWSDRVLLTRDALIERLKARQKYFTGTRRVSMAGTFDVAAELRLSGKPGEEIVITRTSTSDCDRLDGVPVF